MKKKTFLPVPFMAIFNVYPPVTPLYFRWKLIASSSAWSGRHLFFRWIYWSFTAPHYNFPRITGQEGYIGRAPWISGGWWSNELLAREDPLNYWGSTELLARKDPLNYWPGRIHLITGLGGSTELPVWEGPLNYQSGRVHWITGLGGSTELPVWEGPLNCQFWKVHWIQFRIYGNSLDCQKCTL